MNMDFITQRYNKALRQLDDLEREEKDVNKSLLTSLEKRRYRHGIVERRRQIATAIRSLDAELIRLRWNAEAEHRDELDDDDALMQQRSYDEYEDVHSQMAATLMTLTPQLRRDSIKQFVAGTILMGITGGMSVIMGCAFTDLVYATAANWNLLFMCRALSGVVVWMTTVPTSGILARRCSDIKSHSLEESESFSYMHYEEMITVFRRLSLNLGVEYVSISCHSQQLGPNSEITVIVKGDPEGLRQAIKGHQRLCHFVFNLIPEEDNVPITNELSLGSISHHRWQQEGEGQPPVAVCSTAVLWKDRTSVDPHSLKSLAVTVGHAVLGSDQCLKIQTRPGRIHYYRSSIMSEAAQFSCYFTAGGLRMDLDRHVFFDYNPKRHPRVPERGDTFYTDVALFEIDKEQFQKNLAVLQQEWRAVAGQCIEGGILHFDREELDILAENQVKVFVGRCLVEGHVAPPIRYATDDRTSRRVRPLLRAYVPQHSLVKGDSGSGVYVRHRRTRVLHLVGMLAGMYRYDNKTVHAVMLSQNIQSMQQQYEIYRDLRSLEGEELLHRVSPSDLERKDDELSTTEGEGKYCAIQ